LSPINNNKTPQIKAVTDVIAIVQARTGSTRLPGKVMYPLNGRPVLEHVVTRTAYADSVDNVIVATSTEPADGVIEQYAPTFGAKVIRGSESNVLSRFEQTVRKYDSDVILRVTGDCPLIHPPAIDKVVEAVRSGSADYASNITDRTFPRGLDIEAFSRESFEQVISVATTPAEREHVTTYYRENDDEFCTINITSKKVFEHDQYIDRTDLRLTLDEADDYQLLKKIYLEIDYDEILPVQAAIDLVDAEGLAEINESVRQKKI